METTTVEPKKLELIQAQKTRVCAFAREGASVRAKIHKARDRERYDLWNEKRSIGDDARWALLAYAFLRGKPYRHVEPKCRDLNPALNANALLYARKAMARAIMGAGTQLMFGTHEALVAWLSVPETEDRRTKREAAEAAGKARREERRKANAAKRSAA